MVLLSVALMIYLLIASALDSTMHDAYSCDGTLMVKAQEQSAVVRMSLWRTGDVRATFVIPGQQTAYAVEVLRSGGAYTFANLTGGVSATFSTSTNQLSLNASGSYFVGTCKPV